ncbi:MAG: cytochrome P450 [Vulcanimicrobiaceae bacterium]
MTLLTVSVAGDPYPVYAQRVAAAAFARDEELGMWVAASADAVRAVLSLEHLQVRPVDEPVPAPLAGTPLGALFGRLVRMNDGSRHRVRRAGLAEVLRWCDDDRLARGAAACADALIAVNPPCEGALLTRLTTEVPAAALAGLLGLHDDPDLAGDVGAVVRGFAAIDAATIVTDSAAAQRLEARVRRRWTDDDVVANVIGMFTQSYDATAGLIGATVLALANDAALRTLVAADAVSAQRVVREVARWDPPVQNTRRFVVRDVELAGRALRAGESVLVLLAAANRDPSANRHPDRFDPARAEPVSFTFGAGAHACMGERLAVEIAATATRRLLHAHADLTAFARPTAYRGAPNLRIPTFA